MSSFEPIPSSQLKCLDKVKLLLEQLGPSQNDEFVEFVLSAGEHELFKKLSVKEEETVKMETDERGHEPPIKKVKVEKKEIHNEDITTLLRESPDINSVWDRLNSDEVAKDIIISNDKNPEEGLALLMNSLTREQMENNLALEYFQSLLVKYILESKNHQESYETFFEAFLTLYPSSSYDIASQLVVEPSLSSLIICIINMDLMSEEQEKLILCKWLSLFSIESDTLGLPEVVVNKNSKLYEDNQVVVALASSFESGKSSDKCSKFSKFFLQVLSMLGTLGEDRVVQNLRAVVNRNRTFLRRKLEMEMNKKIL